MSRVWIQGALIMGNVMLVYRIMPEDPNKDLEEIKSEIENIVKEHGEYKGSSEEKVAFGLKAVIARIVIPDAGGLVDDIEESLSNIEGVQSVEAQDITLID